MIMTRFTSLILVHFILSSFTPANGNNSNPGKISNFTNRSATDDCGSIYISWEPPTKDIISYHVYIHVHQDNLTINGKPYKPGIFYSTSLTEINVTNLLREVVYKFNISAVNSKGISGEASIINITVIPKDSNIIEYLIKTISEHLNSNAGRSISMVIGGITFVFGAKLLLFLLGFTGAGIAAGSFAAWLMSFFAPIVPGSLVAILQSAGAAGLSLSTQALLFAAGATTGGSSITGLTYITFDDCVVEVVPVNF
jgi:hypothetical protein